MSIGPLAGRRIAVGVGGGIAAYKACDLIRDLRRAGAEVRVAMTQAAQEFVTALTFQSLSGNAVLTGYFEPGQEAHFGHLDFARWPDLYVLAPATADLLARVRAGMANDAVTTSLLAYPGPVLLAPAMNVAMWENRITQQNVKALLEEPRFKIVGPGVGLLADGDVGAGRLAELKDLIAAATAIATQGPLSGKRVLITAGPTREALDPVRFISNPSTGKMGLALAEVARTRGAAVTVVLGPSNGPRPGVEIVDVTTAEEMAREVLSRVEEADYFLAAAAVSDYRPVEVQAKKRKKSAADETLAFTRTPDVLAQASERVRALARRPLLVGFAAETDRVLENAQEKLTRKGLDLIVANDVTQEGAGFAGDTNRVTLLSPGVAPQELAGTKRDVARGIWDAIAALRPKEA